MMHLKKESDLFTEITIEIIFMEILAGIIMIRNLLGCDGASRQCVGENEKVSVVDDAYIAASISLAI